MPDFLTYTGPVLREEVTLAPNWVRTNVRTNVGHLAKEAAGIGLRGVVVPDVSDALRMAKGVAAFNDVIFVGGSTFVVGELDDL